MTDLWMNESYSAPIDFLFDRFIVEYDISKANISILRDIGELSEENYVNLYNCEKYYREVQIGMYLRKKPELNKILSDGFAEARKIFCEKLELEDENILHVTKDSIFVLKRMIGIDNIKTPDKVEIGPHTAFTRRSTYTSYVRFHRNIMYYHIFDIVKNTGDWKIRGIGDNLRDLYATDGLIPVINDILDVRCYAGLKAAYEKCKDWYTILGSKDCPLRYLRRFDSMSGCFDVRPGLMYRPSVGFSKSPLSIDFNKNAVPDVIANLPYMVPPNYGNSEYLLAYVDESMRDYVDPSYNQNIIATLGNYILIEMINGNK